MKKLIAVACLGFIVSASAFAGAQQEKMKGCNMEAKTNALKGEERRAFMSKCLKKDYILKSAGTAVKPEARSGVKPVSSTADTVKQQDKMKKCNENAKTKVFKGEERKAFMQNCLKA